ncbi:MAG: ATP-dependent DNA helicase RecG, partial [Bacteroidales bacterium]|nr:ATP-dependent DNA helicase RecG [Bacteroidales bacterium]
MSSILDTDIKFLTGVGPQRAESLQKELNISTFEDLAYYFPYKYVDKSKFYYTTDIHSDAIAVQLKGVISNMHTEGTGHKQRLTATFSDARGSIDLIWFKGIQYIEKSIVRGKEYIIYGKPNLYNHSWTIAHPDIEDPMRVKSGMQTNFEAHYTIPDVKNSKFTNKAILKLQQSLWAVIKQPLPETLPQYLISNFHLMSLTDALRAIHLPKSEDEISKARARL